MFYDECNLTLLTLYVSVFGTFAAKHSRHGLVKKVFGGMGRRKLLLVVGIKNRVVHNIMMIRSELIYCHAVGRDVCWEFTVLGYSD